MTNPAPIDVLLIGKTGQGKSTLGNMLLGLTATGEGGNVSNHNVGEGLTDTTRSKFDSKTSVESVTKVCTTLYTSIKGRILRVTDTPGFADSGKDLDVKQSNLQTVRQLVRINKKLRFDIVIYLCPTRGVLERADGYLREEMELLYYFFGEGIFRRMIIVVTNEKRAQKFGYNDDDVTQTKKVLESVLAKSTLDKYKTCPPIKYAPLIESKSDKYMQDYVLEQYKQLSAATPLAIREDACLQCACHYSNELVYSTRHQVMKIEESKCHPILLPSSYTAIKSVNYEDSKQTVTFTYDSSKGFENTFGKNQEKCVKCTKIPGEEGCLIVGSEHTVDKFKLKVSHCNNIGYED